MDYLGEKVNSFTSNTLGGMRKKWADRAGRSQDQQRESALPLPSATSQATFESNPSAMLSDQPQYSTSPLSGGIQFGGDTYSSRRSAFQRSPPTIGFRTDLLLADATNSPEQQYSAQSQPQQPGPGSPLHTAASLDVSSESLYQGDTWSRLWFQRVMILCLVRLLLFVRKVYEDFQATKVYNLTGQRGHFLIAATTLFMPTIMFTLYRVARYLQLSLPVIRTEQSEQTASPETQTGKQARQTSRSSDEESQLRRALMSSPDQSAGMATPTPNEDEGLVTARQTPVNMDEFHDSKSQAGSLTDTRPNSPPPRPPPRRSMELSTPAQKEVKLESVNVDKMGDLPDRHTIRLVIGASEQLLHGVLFIFWQLKRQVDVMGYLVERACLWRKPAEREKEQLNRMNCHRDGLEWFQDFYAAFLAILAQVYTLGLYWSNSNASQADGVKQISATQLNAATSGLSSSDATTATGDSQSARIVGSLLGLHATLAGKDVLIMSELIVSSAVIFSLLVCVRRRDDGPLTLGLSMLGWGSLFAARIIIIALAFVHLGWTLMVPLIVLHVLAITGWIYSIALDSHNGRASELGDEAKWDEEAALEQQRQKEVLEMEPSLPPASEAVDISGGEGMQPTNRSQASPTNQTSSWSAMEHVVLLVQILGLFAIPSLFYWPIMFNLKLHLRPFKYLVLVLTQNFLLIPAVWFSIVATSEATPGQLYLLGTVGAFSIMGFIFVSLYVACKPSLTEYFARADELFNEAEKSGIYFEFCSRVFRMPDLSRTTFRRLMNQTEQIEEVEDDKDLDRPEDAETSSSQVNNTQLATNKTL